MLLMSHRRRAFALILAAGLAAGGGHRALAAGCEAPPASARAAGLVRHVVDGDTLVLAGGEKVRLVGIQAPELAHPHRMIAPEPLAQAARDALATLAAGRPAQLWSGGAAADRHGRSLAHVYVPDDQGRLVWLQEALLAGGFARVYTFADNRACAGALYAAERAARAAQRGVWAHEAYRILGADELGALDRAALDPYLGTFVLVTGRVRAAQVVRGRGYLNFGTNWRDDFTIMVPPHDLRRFGEGALADYAGRHVRVRGWLKLRNGPMIEATHPEQIEVLAEQIEVPAGQSEAPGGQIEELK